MSVKPLKNTVIGVGLRITGHRAIPIQVQFKVMHDLIVIYACDEGEKGERGEGSAEILTCKCQFSGFGAKSQVVFARSAPGFQHLPSKKSVQKAFEERSAEKHVEL